MQTNMKTQLVLLWLGPVGTVLLLGGILVAGFLPPPSPGDGAREIHHIYLTNATAIRIGMLIAMAGCVLFGPFVAVISTQMKRVEGRYSPLAYTQLMCGLVNNMLGILPLAFLGIAAFRTGRPPELTLLLNDTCWIMMLGIFFAGELELFTIAACVFKDRRQEVFPRWFGWFSLWIPFLFLPLVLVWFVHGGAFAWNGAICFWFAAAMFAVWVGVTAAVLHRGIVRQARAQTEPSMPAPDPVPLAA